MMVFNTHSTFQREFADFQRYGEIRKRKIHAINSFNSANKYILELIKSKSPESFGSALNLHGIQLAKGLETTMRHLTGDASITVTFSLRRG